MTDTKTIINKSNLLTNTLLAGLRLLQNELDKNPEGHGLELFGELLSIDEINELCESINFGAPIGSIDEEALSDDEIYDRAHQIKSIMSLHYHSIHPYEIAWKTAGNKGFEYERLEILHNRYIVMNFILRSNAIVEDETNTHVYVKTTFTIDAKELSLSRISTLSCGETGDACDLPVSLALQKEVNAACDSMIKEQLAVLSENNIQLLSVDTKDDWTDASLLEADTDKFKEICEALKYNTHPRLSSLISLSPIQRPLCEGHYISHRARNIEALMKDYYKFKWTENDGCHTIPSSININHDQYVDLIFTLRTASITEDEINTDVYVKTTFTIDVEHLLLLRMSALNSEELGDKCDLPVSLALQKQVSAACDLLIKEQLAVLSKHNILLDLSFMKDDWTDASLLETAFDKFEKLRDLLDTYYANHSYLKNEDSTDSDIRLDFQSNVDGDFLEGTFIAVLNYKPDTAPLDKDGNRTSVDVLCRTVLNKGDHEDFNYKVNTSFAASLRELNTGYYISDIEVPALLHKEMTGLCETLAEAQQAFLANHSIESSANPVVWHQALAEDKINEDEESSMGLS